MRCGVPVYLHRDDLFLYERAVEQGQMFGFKVRQPPPVDVFYDASPMHSATTRFACTTLRGIVRAGCAWQVGKKGDGGTGTASVRRGHAVRRLNRPDRSAGRGLRNADAVDYAGPVSAWR